MGAFAVLADEAGSPVSVPVTEIPAEFRFSDTNPITGKPYSQSRWQDLPEYAAVVIEQRLNFCGGEWDVLVEDGEVSEFIDPDKRHSIKDWAASMARKQRTGKRRSGECPDCLGSCVMFDSDGSMTGTVDAPMVCHCCKAPPKPVLVRDQVRRLHQHGWGL